MCNVIRKIFSTNYKFYHVVSCYLEDIEDGISTFNPIKPGGKGGGVIFARGKLKFKLFLNGLWYEPEILLLFVTFTRD